MDGWVGRGSEDAYFFFRFLMQFCRNMAYTANVFSGSNFESLSPTHGYTHMLRGLSRSNFELIVPGTRLVHYMLQKHLLLYSSSKYSKCPGNIDALIRYVSNSNFKPFVPAARLVHY